MPVSAKPCLQPWIPELNLQLRRREFLAWVSALVVAPALPRWSHASVPAGGAAASQPLAIAYLEGSDGWDPAQAEWLLAGARPLPATSLAGGDSDLALGLARLTIQGLYPQPWPAGIFDRLDLSVLFPSPEPDRPEDFLRYFAWSYAESPVVNRGSANRFDVPVGADGALPLELDGTLVGQDDGYRSFADFTVDGDPLRPKLRRGAYLLALAGDPWPGVDRLPGAEEPVAPELMSLLLTVEEGGLDAVDDSGDDPDTWPPPDPDGCGAEGDLQLVGQEVGSERTETACRSITAAEYRVRDQGVVGFDSPTIALGDGFEVHGEFTAGDL